MEKLGKRLGGETDAAAYFSKTPSDVGADFFWETFSADMKAARLSIDIMGHKLDREFVYNLCGHLRKVARSNGIIVNFYLNGRLKRDDQSFVKKLMDEDAHFHLKKGADWPYSKISYIVFDGKVSYEPHDRGAAEFLSGLIPIRTLRLVFSKPIL
jgi:hypothetical protein